MDPRDIISKETTVSGLGGRGRNQGNKAGAGPEGECVCPKCGLRQEHETGMPCYEVTCKKCGSKMMRV